MHKRYGATTALDGVSFIVSEGEFFGLLGPNGAGKTTLLSILSCLLDPTSGEARLLGERLDNRQQELRRQIGIVPQELALYGELTARENLRFFGELYGISRADLARRVDEVLTMVGLEDPADRRVDTFSGGMQRRLNLGAALIHQPRLLLLDEPSVGVDPQSRNHLFEEIRRIHRSGVTIIYTSHYMEEVQALCTRVGIIDHGRLVACDDLRQLLSRQEGFIRLRVLEVTDELRTRIEGLPGVTRVHWQNDGFAVECRDVTMVVVQLVALLKEAQLELTNLQIEEPNLERVFLHLTGRGLRD